MKPENEVWGCKVRLDATQLAKLLHGRTDITIRHSRGGTTEGALSINVHTANSLARHDVICVIHDVTIEHAEKLVRALGYVIVPNTSVSWRHPESTLT